MPVSAIDVLSGALRGPQDRAVQLAQALGRARAPVDLPALAKAIRRHAFELLEDGMAARQVTHLVSDLNDALTRRALELHLERTPAEVPFAWMTLGSEGRQEQTLYTDQDNAVIFDAADAEAARAALLPALRAMNETLARCGFRLCPGGVMAGNARWCLSIDEWRGLFGGWIDAGDPQALLHGSIFFDFRGLSGATGLVEQLRGWLTERVRDRPVFLHLMARNALANRPPLNILNRFRLRRSREGGYFNVKLNAVSCFSDAARIFGLARSSPAVSTIERLRSYGAAGGRDAESWIHAFTTLQGYRLRRQLECHRESRKLDNDVYPDRLSHFDRAVLRACLREAQDVQAVLEMEYQA